MPELVDVYLDRLYATFSSPATMSIYRLLLAESARTPELVQRWHNEVALGLKERAQTIIHRNIRRGVIRPGVLTEHFFPLALAPAVLWLSSSMLSKGSPSISLVQLRDAHRQLLLELLRASMSGVMHIVLRALAGLAIGFVVLLLTVWGALALWHQMPGPSVVRWFVIAMWSTLGVTVVLSRAGLLGRRNRNIAGFAFVIAAASLLMWWGTLQPSHQRVWADDVAQLLEARIDGNHVHLNNVRNFQWRSETDYTPQWESRTYDLDRLRSADLVLSYWMGPHIAHTLVSFGFDGGERVVFSLEIRKERHESFSAVGGSSVSSSRSW